MNAMNASGQTQSTASEPEEDFLQQTFGKKCLKCGKDKDPKANKKRIH